MILARGLWDVENLQSVTFGNEEANPGKEAESTIEPPRGHPMELMSPGFESSTPSSSDSVQRANNKLRKADVKSWLGNDGTTPPKLPERRSFGHKSWAIRRYRIIGKVLGQ